MSLTFYWYPNCGSCKKAKKWFETHDIDYKPIHIVDETPTKEEILTLMDRSQLPARKFFNTSGRRYRELNMKEKINELSKEEMDDYLGTGGRVIKRTHGKDV